MKYWHKNKLLLNQCLHSGSKNQLLIDLVFTDVLEDQHLNNLRTKMNSDISGCKKTVKRF